MENKQDSKPVCKNVFKSGENAISKEKFTKMWADMINKMERGKMADEFNLLEERGT